MSKQDKENKTNPEEPEILLDEVKKGKEEPAEEKASPDQKPEADQAKAIEEAVQAATREQEDKYLRLLAEYDNYRKRSQKEKEMPGPPPRPRPSRSCCRFTTTWSGP